MGLFFDNERKVKAAVADPTGDMDLAVELIGQHRGDGEVAAAGGFSWDRAVELRVFCRSIEAQLLAAIQADEVRSREDALALLKAAAPAGFPAEKFLNRMAVVVGSKVAPATWTAVVAAAKAEDLGSVAAVPAAAPAGKGGGK